MPADKLHNGLARGQARGLIPVLPPYQSFRGKHAQRKQRKQEAAGFHPLRDSPRSPSPAGTRPGRSRPGRQGGETTSDPPQPRPRLESSPQGLCGRKHGPQQPTRKTAQTTSDVNTARCSAVLQAFPQAGAHLSPRGDEAGGRWHRHPHRERYWGQGHWGNGQDVRLQRLVDLVQVWPLVSRVKHTERVGLAEGLGAAGT